MKQNCYVTDCHQPTTRWLRIEWQRSKNISVNPYCKEHAHKLEQMLPQMKLADVKAIEPSW